jgi:signal transduction histidine kinase
MLPNPLADVKRPLFSKIALIFLIASLAVVSAVGGFLFFQRPGGRRSHDSMRKNLVFHLNAVIDHIGTPPDTAKAVGLASELSLGLAIEGPGVHWLSAASIPSLAELKPEFEPDDMPGIHTAHHENLTFFVTQRGPYTYTFVYPGNPLFTTQLDKVFILLVLISVILILSYLAVQWLLSPMGLLVQGVDEISAGNLDYEITLEGGHTEFKSLADAFTQMSGKIKDMLRAKERLLIDVSHELKSPLARMKVALEMLPKSANQKSLARAASEMELMLSEILESERLKSSHGAISKSPQDLQAMALQLARGYRNQAPGVKVLKAKNFPFVAADEAKAATVLKNVIENSLKYSQDQKRAVEIAFSSDTAAAKITVRDYGIGIPESDLPLVFEPFYRVDKSRTKKTGGYGLGLSLCREIMRAHGGEIFIQSQPGSGTQVTLAFPL